MTKWKWMAAARVPAKVLIVNENVDFYWLDVHHWRNARAMLRHRMGLHGTGPFRIVAEVFAFPFTLLLLLALCHRRPCAAAATEPIIPGKSDEFLARRIQSHLMKALVADPIGGAENLKYVDLPEPEPKDGEALVEVVASGVNFIDIYFRTGLYQAPETPVRLGSEGAGVVKAVTPGVELRVGTRVAWSMARGSYANVAAVPASALVRLPDNISFEQGAAVMLQGMTAHYLTRSTFALQEGQTCLVHAAAGGAGLMIVQLAKIAKARVIGTVSTEEKAQLAREHGADDMILYTKPTSSPR